MSEQQSWIQQGLTEPLHSRLWSRAFLIAIFQASQICVADDGCFWHLQEQRHRSLASLVMTWHRTAEYWQETEGGLFVRSGSLELLHLSFFFPEFVVGTVLNWASNIIGECTQASHTGEGDTWSQLPLVGIIGLKCTGGRRRLNMALTLRKQWLLIKQSWQDWESFYWIRR